jgi:hypothetical protein
MDVAGYWVGGEFLRQRWVCKSDKVNNMHFSNIKALCDVLVCNGKQSRYLLDMPTLKKEQNTANAEIITNIF